MNRIYEGHGVKFRHPDDWHVSENQRDSEIHINVSSPDASFWSLALLFDRPDINEVIETAVDVFREEYEELDIYPVEKSLCKRETVGCDIEFVCLELINSSHLRAFQTTDFTAFLLCQATDQDLPEACEVFERISESLVCLEDIDPTLEIS